VGASQWLLGGGSDEQRDGSAGIAAHAILSGVAVWFASAFAPLGVGLPSDEAWTHQVIARSLVEHGSLTFPGVQGSIYASPVWDVLLAINLVTLKVDPSRWAFGLGLVCHVATVNMLHGIVADDPPSGIAKLPWRLACFGGALAVACSADLIGFVASGNETALFVALVMGAAWLATRDRYATAGIVAALAGLTRPEGFAMGALIAVFAYSRTREASRSEAAIAAPLIGGLVVGALMSTGTLQLVSTMWSGRYWSWFEMSAGLPDGDLIVELVSAWITRLGDSMGLARHHPALVWMACALATYGALRLALVRHATGARLLFAFGVVQLWLMLHCLAQQGWGGAWQPFVPLLFVFCASMGSALVVFDLGVIALSSTSRIAMAAGAATMIWLVPAYEGFLAQQSAYRLGVADIEATLLEMGDRVSALPESAVVASYDAGAIAYLSRRPVIDIGRLANTEVASLAEHGRVWEYLRDRNATHVVLPDGFASRLHLDDNPAVAIKSIATVSALSRSFSLYEVSYTGRPGPRLVVTQRSERHALRDDEHVVPRRERYLAEHALAVLDDWEIPVDLALVSAPRSSSGPGCAIDLGRFGVDARDCDRIGSSTTVRAALVEQVQPFLDVQDLGGAVRAIPQALAKVRRSSDDEFVPLLPPTRPPSPGGRGGVPWTAPPWGIALALAILGAACAAGLYAASLGRKTSLIVWLRGMPSELLGRRAT